MQNQTVTENIDEKILSLLGIDDTFDLDYDEYDTLLKEAIVKRSFGGGKLPPEDLAVLSNERKRIRDKKEIKYTTKKTKINVSNFSSLKILKRPQDLAIQKISKKPEENSEILQVLVKDVTDINQTLTNLLNGITEQNKLQEKSSEEERKKGEDEKRKKKESRLETVLRPIKAAAKKILAPVQGILDRIVKFILFTLLGRAFKVFMDWTKDPKNKEKLESLGRFLKDWWPVLLGAWFFFANPLGRFIRTIVGTVAKLTFQLARFAIPRLVSFIAKNPLVAAGLATGAAAGIGYLSEKNRLDQTAKERREKPQKIGEGDWFSEIGRALNPGQLGMGGISPLGLSKGGSVFSGLVGKDTGVSVSGAGPDTQFFPVEGGGGAVLQPGETVLQVGAREKMIKETGVDPLSYNVGPGANIPRRLGNNLVGNSFGGLIGMKGGGVVGDGIGTKNNTLVVNDRPWNSGIPLTNLKTKSGLTYQVSTLLSRKFKGFVDELESTGYRIKYIGGYRRAGGSAKEQGTPAADYDRGRYAHPYGAAIDINKDQNPYTKKDPHTGRAKLITDLPPNTSKMAKKYGFGWGGDWDGDKDAMHFSILKNERGSGVDLNYGGPLWKLPFISKQKPQSKPKEEPNVIQRLISGVSSMFGKPKEKEGQKLQGGGIIQESTGSDYAPDGNRLEGADRQYIPGFFVQPGETHYIFTRRATERGASGLADLIQAKLDPSSNAAKRNIPGPPVRKRGSGGTTVLPPITQRSGTSLRAPARGAPNLPRFSAISSSAYETRLRNAEMYGIV